MELDTTFPGDEHHINAHESGYKDILDKFHSTYDVNRLGEKGHEDLIEFFKPLDRIKLGIHRLANYNFANIDFKKYFSNFVIVLIKPRPERLDVYGERLDKSTPPDYHTQWWAQGNFKEKDLDTVPRYFIEKMSIKEKQKYIKHNTNSLEKKGKIDEKNTIVFDPDNISDPTLLQQMTDNVCDSIGIEKFKITFDEIQGFIDKNKKYLYNKE